MANFPKCKNPHGLPAQLRQHARFCLWRYETVDGQENRKVLYNPATHSRAKANDPNTFGTFSEAMNAGGDYSGLGVGMFGNLAAIDIDHCIENGQLSPMAADIVSSMSSYTEISPSGTGIRILFYAPGMTYDKDRYYIKNPARGLEIYIAGMTSRYVTVTGNRLNSADIETRSKECMAVVDKYMKRPERQQATAPVPARPLNNSDLSDDDIIRIASKSRTGSTFDELWGGGYAGNPSHSEADLALCNMLAFYTGPNPDRIDALFRQSGLMRDKWEQRDRYREDTIQKAIDSCNGKFFEPKPWEPQQIRQPSPAPSVGINQAPPATDNQEETPAPAEPAPKRSTVELFDLFIDKIQTEAYKPIQTGMQSFDTLLGGGLDPQSLVMIGAAPGMGKTTLCQQIFETMASNGHEVIFLNLEMSREQLLARSISRAAYKAGTKITPAQVMRGYSWTDPQKKAVFAAATKYRNTIAPRMAYNPDGTGAGVDSIIETLNNALDAARRRDTPAPVVVLDYLQLVQARERQDPQEAIKAAVKALKDYAIEGHTVACAILAFNRSSNAAGKVTLESGRDTSAIEYSADTLLGLNYAALEDGTKKIDDLDELQQEKPRIVRLKLLKKRMTDAGGKLDLQFDGEAATFTPIETRHGSFDRLPDNTPVPFENGQRTRSLF